MNAYEGVAVNIASAFDFAFFLFARALVTRPEMADNPKDLADDCVTAGLIPPGKKDVLAAFLLQLDNDARTTREKKNLLAAARQALPYFTRIDLAADLRAVLSKEFSIGDNPATFVAERTAIVPIGIMTIYLQRGDQTEPVIFQMSINDIQILKNHLEYLEKELSTLGAFVAKQP